MFTCKTIALKRTSILKTRIKEMAIKLNSQLCMNLDKIENCKILIRAILIGIKYFESSKYFKTNEDKFSIKRFKIWNLFWKTWNEHVNKKYFICFILPFEVRIFLNWPQYLFSNNVVQKSLVRQHKIRHYWKFKS